MIHSSGDAIYAFIHSHLDQELTLQSLSERFGYHKRTIERYFQHRFRQSTHQFIKEQRIIHGYRLLITTDDPTKAIAGMVGYKSIQGFNRAFKRYYNIPPETFRISYQEEWI